MSKTALIAQNAKTQKWEVSFGGRVIAHSNSKKYLIDTITRGMNGKANQLGVTMVEELGVNANHEPTHTVDLVQFDVNERFEFLEDMCDMVAAREMKSAVVVGEGGLGKSYTVFGQLAKNGIRNLQDLIDKEGPQDAEDDEVRVGAKFDNSNSATTYVVVKGHSTARGLFRTLYENRNRLVVFDDCDSILKDDVASNVLKAALDSYDRRIVTWNSEGGFGGESDLPRSFEFTGGVIFISNMPMHKIPQAIISRSAPADVSMTRPEIIERMRQIVAKGEFLKDVEDHFKQDALNFIADQINNPQIRTFNLRTLIMVTTNRRCKPASWKRLSLSMMMAAR